MRALSKSTERVELLLSCLGLIWIIASSVSLAADPAPTATVIKVYDGDTLTLDDGTTVRVRWVNTPEISPLEPFAKQAKYLAEQLVLGKEVSLLMGPDARDGYGRLLAGVKVGQDDLSLALLKDGLGHLFVIPPDDGDITNMLAAQDEARAASRGIWSTEAFKSGVHITSFHANGPGDDRRDPNGEYLRICNTGAHAIDLMGYRLTGLNTGSWLLPSVVVPVGHTVQVHSGVGDDQADPSRQLKVFLDSEAPIWNDTRERVTLYDRYGRYVGARDHRMD